MTKRTFKLNPTIFQRHLLTWFDEHGRKTLPWQMNKSPYRVWVSEIMLQQTQVHTVIPYYKKFIAQFPEINALALADEDAVLHLWTGLGYYSRARNLHRTAKMILLNHAGEFPNDMDTLQKLPGIGRSTAAAILALGFQKKATILDGNVKRVLSRLYGIKRDLTEKKTLELLWQAAEKLTPDKRIADYTQAMMDLGATLCHRTKPNCDACPFTKNCLAHTQNWLAEIPHVKRRKPLPIRQVTFLILQKDHFVLLEKRPAKGIWGGLFSLPEIAGNASLAEIKKFCKEQKHDVTEKIKIGASFRHTFTHFHLDIFPAFISLKKNIRKLLAEEKQFWYNMLQPEAVGLPTPVKLLLHPEG